MKVSILSIILMLPALIMGFSTNACKKFSGPLVSLGDLDAHAVVPTSYHVRTPLLRLYMSPSPEEIDDAFDRLKEEMQDRSAQDAVAKSKKWVDSFYDLFSGINRDMAYSPEEAARNDQVLRKQKQWANKVIDFAAEIGQDISSLDADEWRSMQTRPERCSPSSGNRAKRPSSVTSRSSSQADSLVVYNLQDDDTIFRVDLELPGVPFDKVDIRLDNDTNSLIVRGERQSVGSVTPVTFSQEFLVGSDVDTEKLTAQLSMGILSVSAPKVTTKNQRDKTRRIPVASKD